MGQTHNKINNNIISGTGAIIISPTRELCMQIFTVLTDILKYHSYTYGLLIGGANRTVEVKNLTKGNVLKEKCALLQYCII